MEKLNFTPLASREIGCEQEKIILDSWILFEISLTQTFKIISNMKADFKNRK